MPETRGTLARLAGKGLYPPRLAWALLLPFRDLYLSPKVLAERLGLQENWRVLELGCGPGYFSPFIAKRLARGRLYLTDIQPEMVAKASRRLRRKGIHNAEVAHCDGKRLPYADGMFDAIYLVTVLGEVADQSLCAREMFRVLRPGGLVSVSEQGGDPDRMTLEEVEAVLSPAGFVLGRVYGKARTYTANFVKPADGS